MKIKLDTAPEEGSQPNPTEDSPVAGTGAEIPA